MVSTWKLPRVIAVEVEKNDELNVEALAFDLAAEVELDELLLSRVESKSWHDGIVLVPVAHGRCSGRHQRVPAVNMELAMISLLPDLQYTLQISNYLLTRLN